MKTRFWCYSIHGSVNVDPVQLLFCGDLTILLLGLIIYCLFLVKEKTAPQPSKAIAQRFSSIGICREVAESVKSEYCCYQYLKNCADLTEVFIGDTNVITEIIFSDYYRTFLLCILSIGVVFFMRNASIRKKVLALAGYEFIVFLLFLWIFIVCIIFTEFDYESIIAIVQWELKWILYFTISIILQFAMYYFFWKKSKILKIVTLLFSLIIVIVPLHVFDFT